MVVGIYSWMYATFNEVVVEDSREILSLGAFATMFLLTSGIVLHGATFNVLKSLPHFIMMIPSYVNIMVIFAMANMHDVSWGNRNTVKTDIEIKTEKDF